MMRLYKNQSIYVFLCVLLLFAVSYVLQSCTFLNWDVQSMYLFAKEILSGKDYLHGFTNNNPPFIFFLNMPLVWFSQFFHIWPVMVIRIFTYLMAAISLWVVNNVLTLLFSHKDALKKNCLLFVIAFSFLILPAYEFGQREHLTIMLSLPYIFLTVARVLNKHPGYLFAVLVGVMAGIGIAIKPYFILMPILNELYLLYRKRDVKNLVRPELVALIFVHLIYIGMILAITPNFFNWVFNVILKFEITTATYSYKHVIIYSQAPLLFLVSLFGFFLVRKKADALTGEVLRFLLVSNFAFLLIFILPRRAWYYHELPSDSYSLIILAILVAICVVRIRTEQGLKGLIYQCSMACVYIFATSLSICLCILYYKIAFDLYADPKSLPNQFLHYIKTYAPKGPVDVMTNTAITRYTWALYTSAKPVSVSQPRAIYISPGIMYEKTNPALSQEAFNRATKSLVASYKKSQPALIFIDEAKILPYMKTPFNFINFYLKNAYFKSIWPEYEKVGRIKTYGVYVIKSSHFLHKTSSQDDRKNK